MESRNFIFISIISTGLLIALVGVLSYYFGGNFNSESLISIGLWISELAGFFMLLSNGTFIQTKYFKMLKGVIAIIIIGALFKILHWSYNDIIILIGFVGIIIVYFLSFLKKPIKKRLDFLKLAWVVTAYTIAFLKFKHMINDDYQILSSSLMWLSIIDYFKVEKEKGTLFK